MYVYMHMHMCMCMYMYRYRYRCTPTYKHAIVSMRIFQSILGCDAIRPFRNSTNSAQTRETSINTHTGAPEKYEIHSCRQRTTTRRRRRRRGRKVYRRRRRRRRRRVYSKLTQWTERWTSSATALPRCRRRDPPYCIPGGDSRYLSMLLHNYLVR